VLFLISACDTTFAIVICVVLSATSFCAFGVYVRWYIVRQRDIKVELSAALFEINTRCAALGLGLNFVYPARPSQCAFPSCS